MTEFPVSMIHPDAPEMLSATALFTAPIDLEAAAARVGTLWNESIASEWEEGGSILRFALRDVVVLLSPVPGEAVPERGRLPAHGFHVALTCFAPMQDVGGFGPGAGGFRRENGGSGGEFGDRAVEAGGSGIPGFTGEEIAELGGASSRDRTAAARADRTRRSHRGGRCAHAREVGGGALPAGTRCRAASADDG